MRVTSKTFQSEWYLNLYRFGPEIAARALVQLIQLFDSAEGYYFTHENCDQELLGLFLQADLVEPHDGVFTSEWLQREFVRNAGKAKARRNTWQKARLLSLDELISLGIIPAHESTPDQMEVDLLGVPVDIPGHPDLVKIRIRARRHLHVYRIVKRSSIVSEPAPVYEATAVEPFRPMRPKSFMSLSARNELRRELEWPDAPPVPLL